MCFWTNLCYQFGCDIAADMYDIAADMYDIRLTYNLICD